MVVEGRIRADVRGRACRRGATTVEVVGDWASGEVTAVRFDPATGPHRGRGIAAGRRGVRDREMTASVPTDLLDRWRADTPGTSDRIHLNNAGAALMPRPVIEAVTGHIAAGGRIGGYEAEEAVAGEVADVYEALASLIGARVRNVAVVENATVAVSQALSAFDFRPGDVIVTPRNDYTSNQLMYLALAAAGGVEVLRADDLPAGGVDPVIRAASSSRAAPRAWSR